MGFDIEKCSMRIMKSETTEGIEQENIRTFGEKENYKYLRIMEAAIIQKGWKKK